jgi:arylsulfatase A-like enzyme
MRTAITILTSCLVLWGPPPAFAATAKPNILFVLFDDLGYGQPPCYNPQSALRTPSLDKLAREGMRFTDAHSASAVCTPTRYGLLTGRYPSRIGQFGVLTTYSPPIIPDSRLTVAALLRQNGYTTACIGKWHLGMQWDGKPGDEKTIPVGTKLLKSPNAAGFDYFYGFTHARNIGTIIEQDRVAENVSETENQPRMIAKAVQWIEKRDAAQPFFLYFPMCPPHTPIAPAPEFIGKSGAKDLVKQDAQYGDWLFQGDHMLGQLLDALERKGLAANTLVIATSDNGAASRSYAPLRGQKTSIYEGGHRVPFVARWPGHIKPGTVSDQTICHNDLIATCAEITATKLPANAGEDSVSILPALLGTASAPMREATLHQSMSGDLAIRQGPWKLIFHKNGERELFDLTKDLSETQNVVATNAATATQLTTLTQSYIARGRSTAGDPQKNEFRLSLAAKAKEKQPRKKSKADPQ